MLKDRSFLIFILVSFILGMTLQFFYMNDKNTSWLLLSMWAPAIAVLAIWKSGKTVFANLKRFQFSWVLLAVALAFIPHLLAQVIIYFFNLGSWNEAFILTPGSSAIEGLKKASLVLGNGHQGFSFFALNLFLSALLGGLVTTVIATLGEEIGWRGYLQLHLSERLGPLLGTLMVGVIWAYWHVPANLGGINGKEHVLLVTFILFPMGVIFLSFVLGWLRLNSGAIWPCAFYHGINNTISGIHLYTPTSEFIGNIVDLLVSIVVGTVFIYLIYQQQKKSTFTKYS